jgi:hypothetical protein
MIEKDPAPAQVTRAPATDRPCCQDAAPSADVSTPAAQRLLRALADRSGSGLPTAPAALAPSWQRQAGNAATRRLLQTTGIQPKLAAATTPDPLEQEADRVAEHAVSGASALPVRAGGLDPIAPAGRDLFQRQMGHDLGQVRVHTDSGAAHMAADLGAQAFTRGQEIYFGAARYQPDTRAGQELLAHELAHTVQQRQGRLPLPAPAIQRQADTPPDQAQQFADEVYDALDGWNNEARAIRALNDHDAAMRTSIAQRFLARRGLRIQDYLKDQLGGDWLVRAFALLSSSNIHEHHTAMALALIPLGTRDEDLFRILDGLPLAGRREMERLYGEAFREIGKGSLVADLKDDLSGWRKEKSLAMLNRDLTSADALYFDSVAITGTHTDAVINRIQAEWDKGPQSFIGFERDWNHYVRNDPTWTDERWSGMSLYDAMDDELSGEEWELVRSVLRGYQAYQAGINVEVGPLSENQIFRRENIELQVAEETLTAATTGGYTGAGTNEEQVNRAVTTLRRVWEGRIARAEAAHDTALVTRYRQQWDTRRQLLMGPGGQIESEMDTDSADYKRVRLLTLGDLTPADDLYLAKLDLDNDKVVRVLTTAWAHGQINSLLTQAGQERRDGSNQVVRPIYDPTYTVPVTSGMPFRRVLAFTSESDDPHRGAAVLHLEIEDGDNDSDLQRGYQLLTTAGLGAPQRSAIIATYAGRYLGDLEGDPATRFVSYISKRYENSNAVWEFKDLIAPTFDPQEMVTRARGRLAASRTGLLNRALSRVIDDYDVLTGEDTQQVTEESLARLDFIARNAGARPDELQAMMAMTGAKNPQDLAGMEYSAFRSRLEELRQLKRSITEAIATAIELAVEAVLTVATGGAAGAALLVSLSAAVAGMVARELLLGQDYDLISEQNAQQLLLTVASHGFNVAGRGAFASVISPERLRAMGRAGMFLEGAATEAISQVGTQTLLLSFQGHLPTAEEISASALTVLGSAAGAGVSRRMTASLGEHTPDITRLRTTVLAHVTQNVIGGVSNEGAQLVKGGVGNMTWADITQRTVVTTGNAIGRGVLSGTADFGGQKVAQARQRRAAGAQPDDEEGDPNQAPGTPAAGQRAAHPGEPEILRVVRVNDEHSLSVLRNADGSISVILCSPVCGRIRQLLQAAQQQHKLDLGVHLDEVNRLEQRLNANPDDPDARRDLDHLAEDVDALLRHVDQRLIFGTPAAGAPAAAGPTVASLINNGQFTDPALQQRYMAYVQAQQAAQEPVAPPEIWARRTRGTARERLDALLGDGWITRVGGAPPAEPRGEVHLQGDAVQRILGTLPPYPHGETAPFPVHHDQELSLGPSPARAASGEETWLPYLRVLPTLGSDEQAAFDLAVHASGSRAAPVLDTAGQTVGHWPVDGVGTPWVVHHTLPLEWGGPDIPSNWVAVPYNVHQDLHRWWEGFRRAVLADEDARRTQQAGGQAQHVPGADSGGT